MGTEDPLSKLTAIKKRGLLFPWAALTFFLPFIHMFLDSRAQRCYRGAGKGSWEFSILGCKKHSTCCVPCISMNRDLTIACAIWMQPDLYHVLRKWGYGMSPGCKMQVWAVCGKGAVVTLGVTRWACPMWLVLVPIVALCLKKRVVIF